MRVAVLILAVLIGTAAMAGAQAQLPEIKVGPRTYHNVTVLSVSSTDILFTSDDGMANAKLKSLDPALQKLFHYHGPAAGTPAAAPMAPIVVPLSGPAQPAAPAAVVPAAEPAPAPVDAAEAARRNAQLVMEDAIERVKAIVNQPVKQLAQKPEMKAAVYKPGWFYHGAIKPDFSTVDVRKTQETRYGDYQYVTSDLNPGVVFAGPDLEFNPMTKYFYEDRSLPKKKLTEAEMLEVNRLYRIIGKCEEQLKQ